MALPNNALMSSADKRRQLAKLSDERPQPVGAGYLAERHPLLPSLTLVWAECGCVWVGDGIDDFITPCGKEACDFVWHEAVVALSALRAAEQAAPETPAIALVEPAAEVPVLPEPVPAENLDAPKT